METVRYSLLGAQDIKAGFGTFEVVLADGRTVVLDDLNLSHLIPAYAKAALPTASVAGRIARVTDDARGLWMDTGTLWSPQNGRIFNVMDYGAKGDFTTDDTDAINACIAAAYLNLGGVDTGGIVYFPAGLYLITGTILIEDNRIHLMGAGKHASTILFNPTANSAPCVHFTKGASVLYQCSIRRLGIMVTGTATGKIGIQASDTSELVIEDVAMLMGTTLASVGIKLRGRELTTLNRCSISAVQPLIIAANPNSSAIGCDTLHVHDFVGLAPAGSDVITAEDAAPIFNLLFDGTQNWVGGRHGFTWAATHAAADLNLAFKNVRREQDSGGVMFNLNRTVGFPAGILFENCEGATGGDGWYLRNCRRVTIRDCTWLRAAGVALNADNTNARIVLSNFMQQTGSSKTIGTGLLPVYRTSHTEVGTITDLHTIYDVPSSGSVVAPSINAGTGTAVYRPAGVLHWAAADLATVTTGEEILHSYTMPGNTLNLVGRGIRVTAYLLTANNANSKTARIRFNGIAGSIIANVTTTTAAAFIKLMADVILTGASAQAFGGSGLADANLADVISGTAAINNTGDIVIAVTGETPTAIGDLTCRMTLVELL